jgi:methyl-accepting chemotaxis protein
VAGLRHRLTTQFTGLFLLMAAIVAATGAFGLRTIGDVGTHVQDMLRARSAQEKMAVLMKVSMQEARVHLFEGALLSVDADALDFAKTDYELSRDRLRGYIDLLLKGNAKVGIEAAPKGSKLEERVLAVRQAWTAFEGTADRILERKAALLAAGGTAPGKAAPADADLTRLIQEEIPSASEQVDKAVDEVLVVVNGLAAETRVEVAALRRDARNALAVVVAAAVVLALVLGLGSTRRMVIAPIMALREAAQRIASGDLTITLPISRRDEIAMLAETINTMTANLKQMFLKIQEVTGSLGKAAADIVASSGAVMSAADVQRAAIEATAAASRDLSESTVSVAEGARHLSRSAAETSEVIAGTRRAIERVAESSDVMDSSTQEAASSIHEMLTTIKEISRALELLSSSAESIASSSTQASATTREIERHAEESVGLAGQVLAEASGKGATAARSATAGIEQIRASVGALAGVIQSLGSRSRDVGAILTIIDEIADRTNLLALNAAILSAQAGVHGRGFAVVAAEIKHLADKTSSSVKEIAGLIVSVQEESSSSVQLAAAGIRTVEEGLQLVGEVDRALQGIAARAVDSSEMAKAIQRSTTEEAVAIRQIADAIKGMSMQVENISAALQEQSKGSTFIMSHTERVQEISRQVRDATQEQRGGSAHMVEAVENVAGSAEEIARATELQRRTSAEIVHSVTQIQETTGKLVRSSNELKGTTEALSSAAAKLDEELRKFTV